MGIYPRELNAGSQKDTGTPVFVAALRMMVKRWKQPKCPWMDGWTDAQNEDYPYNGMYSA